MVILFSPILGAPRAQAPLDLALVEIADGLEQPVYVTHAGDASGRLFVLEQPGRIRIIDASGQLLPTPFLDIGSRVRTGSEQGLLGLAFHPDFTTNRQFFVHYSQSGTGDSVVARFEVPSPTSDVALTTETRILGPLAQPQANHNGGMIEFGPTDRMLYIALGDGGGQGDPHGADGNGQNLATLLGSILRIDVDNPDPPMNYGVPMDNPYADDGDPLTRGEIWAWGFRNPWRFSFDRTTQRMFAGDVGHVRREEIDIIVKGGNYGWRFMEGEECYNPADPGIPLVTCDMSGLLPPIHDYPRTDGRSVTGGYVYRGASYPNMVGRYFFGDFSLSRIYSLEEAPGGAWSRTFYPDAVLRVSSFGEDELGELYACDHSGGRIVQLVDLATPAPSGARDSEVFE